MLFSTVNELVTAAIAADQLDTAELEKQAQSVDQAESEVAEEISAALEEAGYGEMEKRASQVGMAKLLISLDILSKVA